MPTGGKVVNLDSDEDKGSFWHSERSSAPMSRIDETLSRIDAQVSRLEAAAARGGAQPDVQRIAVAIDALLERVEAALAKARAVEAALER
jgi:hypothetical protein